MQLLNSALRELATIDRRAHDIVEMRYFGGLSLEEIADATALCIAMQVDEYPQPLAPPR